MDRTDQDLLRILRFAELFSFRVVLSFLFALVQEVIIAILLLKVHFMATKVLHRINLLYLKVAISQKVDILPLKVASNYILLFFLLRPFLINPTITCIKS